MNLIVDAGNTLVKLAVFQNDILVEKDTFEKEVFSEKIYFFFEKYFFWKFKASHYKNLKIVFWPKMYRKIDYFKIFYYFCGLKNFDKHLKHRNFTFIRKNNRDESKSINKKEKCRLQDCTQKRAPLRY